MCQYCEKVPQMKAIDSPKKYEKIVEFVKALIDEDEFLLVEGTCPIGEHRNKNGCWVDDDISHTIKCPKCGQEFRLYVNTYRGGGSFTQR